jgi:hypothetical protein
VDEAHSPPLGILFLGIWGANFRRHGRRLRRLFGTKKICFLFFDYLLPIREIFLFFNFHNIYFLFYNFPTSSKPISHNVPAVGDVPARPIKQTVGLRAGWNVPE